MSLLLRRRMLIAQKQYKGYNVLYAPNDFSVSNGNSYVKYDSQTQVYDMQFTGWGIARSLCKLDTAIPAGTPYTILAEALNDDFEITDSSHNFVIGLFGQGTWSGDGNLSLNQLTPSNKIIKKTGVTTLPTTDIWFFRNTVSNMHIRNLKVRFLVYFGTDEITEWEPCIK